MLLDWLEHEDGDSRLLKWGELQSRLTQGFRLPGYTEEEVRHALGHD